MKNKKEQDQNNEPKKLTPAKQIVKDFLDRQDNITLLFQYLYNNVNLLDLLLFCQS